MADAGDRPQPGEDRGGDRQRARGARARRGAGRADLVLRAGRRAAARRAALATCPAITPESKAMAKELKRRGFRFVGPTTAYALMQACGLVDDHLAGCSRGDAARAARAAGEPRAGGRAAGRGALARARAGGRARTCSSTWSRRSTGARRWTARTRPLGGAADLEMLLALRDAGRRRADRAGHACAPRATRGWCARRSGARAARPPGCRRPGRGADLAPPRHPVGGGPVRRRRPAGARLHGRADARRAAGRRRAGRGRPPRRVHPGRRARRPARARGVRALLCEGGPTLLPRRCSPTGSSTSCS